MAGTMRYRLATLVLLTAIGPPLIAAAYWTGQCFYAYPGVPVLLALIAASILGPVACYRGLMRAICGPDLAAPSRRRSRRRHIRFRLERYAESS